LRIRQSLGRPAGDDSEGDLGARERCDGVYSGLQRKRCARGARSFIVAVMQSSAALLGVRYCAGLFARECERRGKYRQLTGDGEDRCE